MAGSPVLFSRFLKAGENAGLPPPNLDSESTPRGGAGRKDGGPDPDPSCCEPTGAVGAGGGTPPSPKWPGLGMVQSHAGHSRFNAFSPPPPAHTHTHTEQAVTAGSPSTGRLPATWTSWLFNPRTLFRPLSSFPWRPPKYSKLRGDTFRSSPDQTTRPSHDSHSHSLAHSPPAPPPGAPALLPQCCRAFFSRAGRAKLYVSVLLLSPLPVPLSQCS